MRVGIIGGGIAGLALSIDLAQRGVEAVVFEKKRYPNHKVCGEYVSAESSNYLSSLGVMQEMEDCPRINRLVVSSPSGKLFNTQMKVGGIGISRYKFDDLLFKKAIERGVQFVFEEVTHSKEESIQTKERVYEGFNQIVGAYGKRSNLDVKWDRNFANKAKNRLNQWVGIKYHIKYDGIDDKTIALHNFDHGYCGISKVEADITCLCYLVSSKMLKNRNIEQLEEEILSLNPFLKSILNRSQILYDKPLAISQISFDKKELNYGEVQFIGDAAGLITPLCGNGMSLALRSAQMMAKSITEEGFNYSTQWQKTIAPQLKWGRRIQAGFGSPILTELLVLTCKLIPGLGRFLVSKSHGEEF